jgi:hypothetical protein
MSLFDSTLKIRLREANSVVEMAKYLGPCGLLVQRIRFNVDGRNG